MSKIDSLRWMQDFLGVDAPALMVAMAIAPAVRLSGELRWLFPGGGFTGHGGIRRTLDQLPEVLFRLVIGTGAKFFVRQVVPFN